MSWVSAWMLTQCSQNPEVGLEASSRQLVQRLKMLDGWMYYVSGAVWSASNDVQNVVAMDEYQTWMYSSPTSDLALWPLMVAKERESLLTWYLVTKDMMTMMMMVLIMTMMIYCFDIVWIQWHLGFFNEAYTPTRRGFDSHYGYFAGRTDYFDHTYCAAWPDDVSTWTRGFDKCWLSSTCALVHYLVSTCQNHASQISISSSIHFLHYHR